MRKQINEVSGATFPMSGVVNGPLKNEKYPSLGISHNLLMGLGVSDFVSAGHIFARLGLVF